MGKNSPEPATIQADPSDAALVLAARDGDKGAFAVLLIRHRPLLLALCRRALGNPVPAEDAAQEAALRALLSLDRLREPARFGAWLGGIGLNVCRQWLRERSRDHWSWEALTGGRRLPEPVDWQPGPEELAEAADLAERVRSAVAVLPPGQRAAVLLFYLVGLTHAETAALLGVEVSAVKTRLHKARATLRRQLLALRKEEDMATDDGTQLVEMRVVDVRRPPAVDDKPRTYVVLLREADGARYLAIWIGRFEAESIALQLEKDETPRPLTYAFTANLLQAAGGRLREVRISKLEKDTFYALAVVEGPEGTRHVDARPSDALNLALVAGVPIRVESAVLETAGVREEAAAQPSPPGAAPSRTATEGVTEIVAEIRAQRRAFSTPPPEPRA